MPRVGAVEGRQVVGLGGGALGRVGAVLFHPHEPRVVGLMIDRPPFAYVIARRSRFVLLEDVREIGEQVTLSAKRVPPEDRSARVLGASWDETVMWRGMGVRSVDGDRLGTVHDASFAAGDGSLNKLWVSTGVVGDAALGRLEVDGEHVRGFDGDDIVVLPGYAAIKASGGAAKQAAMGAAMVSVHGKRLARSALRASGKAAGAVRRSFRSGAGRSVIDAFKSLTDDDE